MIVKLANLLAFLRSENLARGVFLFGIYLTRLAARLANASRAVTSTLAMMIRLVTAIMTVMTSSFARILISLLSLIHTAIVRELFDTSQSELGNHSLIVARLNLWLNLLRSRLLSNCLLRVIQILVTRRVRTLISGVGVRHSVLMTVLVFIRTVARRNFARFFYSTNLFENFFQIFIILEMYREFNGFATECNIDLRFTNPMRHSIHSIENFDFEFVDCQI